MDENLNLDFAVRNLISSISHGDKEKTITILDDPELKIDVNMDTKILHSLRLNSPSFLSIAASKSQREIALELIKRGAHIDNIDERRCTPLSWACQVNDEILVEAMITEMQKNDHYTEKKIKEILNLGDHNGRTPLFFAVGKTHDLLIEAFGEIIKRPHVEAYGTNAGYRNMFSIFNLPGERVHEDVNPMNGEKVVHYLHI